ncbi:YbaB/EbfC family nucleoid-associated protein [Plantactinospora sp. KLBMP9567]|uniref:YbaB/EbfC family nucleoid-associated protein n=1 Tax=Plantactinospora sp. KLBMP9567 TaxID=3085900 RepID=UPI002981687E|nr:YbaB/EbfC family nucleoid-associated protein [Plantactinospora sp. KLBMP9567]MDW5327946.1 YbaB/EbfC family nucleoid-associated protein [Plantactinospora sp. KLBMP9567]
MTRWDGPDDFAPLVYSPHDEARYEELARRALSALDTMDGELQRLAAAQVEGHSRDGRVGVRVTGAGVVTEVRLRGAALQHYNHVKLGEVVTRVLRATQQRARAAYEQAVDELTPPEVAECERLIRQARRSREPGW